jgi:hypothetical protein
MAAQFLPKNPKWKGNSPKEQPMRKLIPICIAVALAIALLGTHYHVRAEEQHVVGSPILGQRLPNLPPAVNHKLTHTYVDIGAPDASDASGFTAIDSPVTINCGNTAGCTIVVTSFAEPGGQTSSGDAWGICTNLDGTIGAGICTFQGVVPSDGSFVSGSFTNVLPVTKGSHTVQAELFLDSGATLAQYSNTYSQYAP